MRHAGEELALCAAGLAGFAQCHLKFLRDFFSLGVVNGGAANFEDVPLAVGHRRGRNHDRKQRAVLAVKIQFQPVQPAG